MRKRLPCLPHPALLLAAGCFLIFLPVRGKESDSDTALRLRQRIENAGYPCRIVVDDALVYAQEALPLFYERRLYSPAWSRDNRVTRSAAELVSVLREASDEGLNPEDYHLSKIETIMRAVTEMKKSSPEKQAGRLTDLDLLCTDAFLVYGSHLVSGKVNPEKIDPQWLTNRRERNLLEILESALRHDAVRDSLAVLLPQGEGYWYLRRGLARCMRVQASGGWPLVPRGSKMERGMQGDRVAALRTYLEASGYLQPRSDEPDSVFTEAVEQAVRLFQTLHGLDVDGVAGQATVEEMNVPVEDRIRQIRVNMERWRWLPQDLGQTCVLINIANFELDVIHEEQLLMTLRIMAGKPYRRTPVFSDRISYIVFNPYWVVPPGISAGDLMPQIRKDPAFLSDRRIRVFRGWGEDRVEVSPDSIDWMRLPDNQRRYWFRQDPGPQNALGRMKFMFPNKFDIYVHDTPSRNLFSKTERAFSSGCIRVEKPEELALFLLKEDPQWTRLRLNQILESGEERTVRLPVPVPIHILYWTVWLDKNDRLQYRKDIYYRDAPLWEALTEAPPRPEPDSY